MHTSIANLPKIQQSNSVLKNSQATEQSNIHDFMLNQTYSKFLKHNSNLKQIAVQIASKYLSKRPLKQPSSQKFEQMKKLFSSDPPSNLQNELKIQQKKLSDAKKQFEKESKKQQHNLQFQTNLPKIDTFQDQSDVYYFYLGQGNNANLIRRVLLTRDQWKECKNLNQSIINFKWQQGSKGYKYEKLIASNQMKQLVNHFEFHNQLSDKQYLFKNLEYYCEQTKLNVFDYIPVTFIIDCSSDQVDENINHFLQFYHKHCPATKKESFENLQRKFLQIKRNLPIKSNPVPRTYNYKYQKPFLAKSFQSERQVYLWLLKPTNFNRGRGIHLIDNILSLSALIVEYQEGFVEKNNQSLNSLNILKTNQFIIQKYIERPLLIQNRKFDIRIWVLITQDLNVFQFKEGYIRTTSYEYQLNDITNDYIHLTNNAIQKHSSDYGVFEQGNQLSFENLCDYIKNDEQIKNIQRKMKEIIWMTVFSVKKKINQNERKYCMEIFGYDFMVDEQYRTWLIEINTNPCLEESSQLLKNLLPRMIGQQKIFQQLILDDAFKLTLDILFQVNEMNKKNYFSIKGYNDLENMWELLGNLKQ